MAIITGEKNVVFLMHRELPHRNPGALRFELGLWSRFRFGPAGIHPGGFSVGGCAGELSNLVDHRQQILHPAIQILRLTKHLLLTLGP